MSSEFKAMDEGAGAFAARVSRNANPYPEKTRQHDDWFWGWDAAMLKGPAMPAVKHQIPGGGYFEIHGERVFVYADNDDVLLNLDGPFNEAEMAAFIAREFPSGLNAATAEAWIEK